MKKEFLLVVFVALVSCKKNKEIIKDQQKSDSVTLKVDSIQNLNIENPNYSGVFEVVPQNIEIAKGKTVFYQNGKALFYFDQNSNKGNIKIDGKDYALNRFDFNENNYSLFGDYVQIEATNGDFKEQATDCIQGVFSEVKVSLNEKTLNLPNISVQDCPNY